MPIFLSDGYTSDKPADGAVELAVFNLTPSDGAAEERFLKILQSSPLSVKVTFARADGCPAGQSEIIYKAFTDIEKRYFDGIIFCGEPECNAFNRFGYWKEFKDILGWTGANVTAAAFTGWSAQAAMYFYYGVKKHNLKDRCYGIFQNRKVPDASPEPIMRGISDEFTLPHDHRSYVKNADVMRESGLKILAYSKRAGASVVKSTDGRRLFITAHPEYDRFALKTEFERARKDNSLARPPVNYFADKNFNEVRMNWASASSLLILNWLNLCAFRGANTASVPA